MEGQFLLEWHELWMLRWRRLAEESGLPVLGRRGAAMLVAGALLVLAATGCTTSRLIESTDAYYGAGPEASLEVLETADEIRPEDRFLAAMETAMSLHELGRYEESNLVLDEVIRCRDTHGKAGDVVAGLLVNEEAGTYYGESFEQVYLQTLRMANSLALQDVTAAAAAAEEALATLDRVQCHRCRFAFTRFLAALSLEHASRPERAEEVLLDAMVESPHLEIFSSEIERLAATAERNEAGFAPPPVAHEGRRELVIILMLGRGPQKEESGIPVPASHAVMWPRYEPRGPQVVVGADLRMPRYGVARSVLLTDMLSLAESSLEDRIASLVARELAKTAVQEAAVLEVGNDLGLGAEIILRTLFMAADRADLRHWSSLPATCQVIRVDLPADVESSELRYLSRTGEVVDREELRFPPEWNDGPLFVSRRMP